MAKIDIRENRAEMPERRNVLRKVISPAVAEVAVEIRTEKIFDIVRKYGLDF